MLATLERPARHPLVGAEIRIVAPLRPSVSSVPLPSRPAEPAPTTALAPTELAPTELAPTELAPTEPSVGTWLLPVQAPFTRPRPVIGNAGLTSLRMTVRARRLLATLVLLCSAGLGIVAADVFSAVAQHVPAGSYPAQEAPYAGRAPEGSTGSVGSGALVPAADLSITVLPGDSLWTLAQRVDPDADPRRVIAAIMTLNELETPTVQPGQILLLP